MALPGRAAIPNVELAVRYETIVSQTPTETVDNQLFFAWLGLSWPLPDRLLDEAIHATTIRRVGVP